VSGDGVYQLGDDRDLMLGSVVVFLRIRLEIVQLETLEEALAVYFMVDLNAQHLHQ
jgi:hypothetical protein